MGNEPYFFERLFHALRIIMRSWILGLAVFLLCILAGKGLQLIIQLVIRELGD